jgi:glucose-1-phosphate thymidylyltransferase
VKGVILAGGTGTRLLPLTRDTNKHLLTVHDRPMVAFAIETLVAAGIREVQIVTGYQHESSFRRALGDGRRFGLDALELAFQPAPAGIADALRYAEPFARGERICVVLGDNLFGQSIAPFARAFAGQRSGARFLLKKAVDPRGFGIARFDGPPPEGPQRPRLAGIVEKPAEPPSDLAVTGIYFYDPDVFTLCRGLRPSLRGELEITDLNNAYIARGDAEYDLLEGWWTDAGTREGLERAARLVASERRG